MQENNLLVGKVFRVVNDYLYIHLITALNYVTKDILLELTSQVNIEKSNLTFVSSHSVQIKEKSGQISQVPIKCIIFYIWERSLLFC